MTNKPADHCQCEQLGRLNPGFASWYDSELELPFVNHQPHQCKCTNRLTLFVRDGKLVTLCSCCWTSDDTKIESYPDE